jgi:hypothetical protein
VGGRSRKKRIGVRRCILSKAVGEGLERSGFCVFAKILFYLNEMIRTIINVGYEVRKNEYLENG